MGGQKRQLEPIGRALRLAGSPAPTTSYADPDRQVALVRGHAAPGSDLRRRRVVIAVIAGHW